MSQPSLARGESNGTWLPLIEYSVRSGLSLSTIRRKIKSHTLTYRMENGRYLIFFEGATTGLRSYPVTSAMTALAPRPAPVMVREPENETEPERGATMETQLNTSRLSENSVDGAIRMVSEAFECALREKDERIQLLEANNRSLEERLNELRLLVKVLEEKYEVRY